MSTFPFEHTKALAEKVTPGPWEWDEDDWLVQSESCKPVVTPREETEFDLVQRLKVSPADAEFIADARSAVPALVAAVERVQALHTREEASSLAYCRECGCEYPCPTIRALETP